jgi:hypothetical protein
MRGRRKKKHDAAALTSETNNVPGGPLGDHS